ncbi:MAG TPA: xanthine dehydrogenase family protein molybdopterin-binding subunit [Luteibacter sp.]|nr:xanthine dehydrogenase family protein molybdopterin-binding subunit [Luteibacter sp.]
MLLPRANDDIDLGRRRAIQVAGGLTVAFLWLGAGGRANAAVNARRQAGDAEAAAADGNPAFAPNAFIRIDADGSIRLVMAPIEMGQGTYTGIAMLLAEELGAGLDQISVEHSPPDDALYAMPLLGAQITGGSTSIRGGWQVFREAGAVARTLLVQAAATKWKVDPTSCTVARAVVTHAASGRTIGFGDIAGAAANLSMPDKVTLKDPKDFTIIGKPLRRVDSAQKVDGSTQFGLDVRVPGMKVASVLACPTFGGKLASVDDTRARKMPGVIDVIRIDNAVAVVGEHYWAAKKGLDALDVHWDLGANATLTTEKLIEALAETSRSGTAIVARQVGEQDAGTGKRIEATYELPLLAHATMEPLNTTVSVTPDGCEIWVGTQVPTRAVASTAKILGIPANKVTLHNQYLGGGFGRRLETDSIEQAVAFARQVKYPLKVVWSREEDIRHDMPRPMYYDRIAATLDAEGKPVFWSDRITSSTVTGRFAPMGLRKDGLDPDAVECAAEPPYELPNLHVEWLRHDMPDGLVTGWWRGVGPTHNLFTVESFVDELAHVAGKDPLDYRRMLLQKNPRTLAVLNMAAEKFGWDGKPLPARVGRGLALGEPFGSRVCAMVEVEVSPQGVVAIRRAVAVVDCGIAINPNSVEAQIQGGLVFGWTAALHSGLTIKNGAFEQSNFNDYRMLRLNETPPIAIHIVPSAEAPGGIGEVGTAIAAPCLANAVFAATGIRVRNLPLDRTPLGVGGDAQKAVVS